VKGGSLIDKSTVTLNPVNLSGLTYSLPVLVVDQAIQMNGSNRTLNATGLVCTSTGITNSSPNASTQVNITGALLITAAGGGISNGVDKVNLTYNSAYTNVLSLVASEPPAIKIMSWSE
jgi:hypothetical protein